MSFNYILLVILFLVLIGGIFLYIKGLSKEDTEEFEFENTLDVSYLVKAVDEGFSSMLKQNLNDANLSKKELEIKKKKQAEVKLAKKEASFGSLTAKRTIKTYIKDFIQQPKIGVNKKTINHVIKFNESSQLSSGEKFQILLFCYSKKFGKEGLNRLIGENNLLEPIKTDTENSNAINLGKEMDDLGEWYETGEEFYEISKERMEEAYLKQIGTFTLSYADKLEILSHIVFQQYIGLGAIDILTETNVDEIDAGVSGIPKGGFEIDASVLSKLEYSYDSIWVLYRGLNLKLSCLTFGSQKELVRITRNVYKYEAQDVLSREKGYVVSSMLDGSRIVAIRPPFSDSYGFFYRKFDSTPSIAPEDLIKERGKLIPILLMKWLIRGQRNIGITGSQGTGKTTFLKSLIRFIPTEFNLRVQEMAFELNLRFAYPKRNIVTFQEWGNISAQAGLNLQKKTNGAVNVLGEIAQAIQASHLFQMAGVASLFALFTHHAKTARDLIYAIAGNLTDPTVGLYKDLLQAVEDVAKLINIDCHLTNQKGHRYIERITEIIPLNDRRYPSEREGNVADYDMENLKRVALLDTMEYYKRRTDREFFAVQNLCEFNGSRHVLIALPSEKMQKEIIGKLNKVEELEFLADMQRIVNINKTLEKMDQEERSA